ncbi:hypothetical protein Misp01_53660 [Microtetraspora sp. NBRC 13810]|uniref:substrate-binding domain-containing protein n=1 Tax=Microtetraspora sp. NBRC 13810 TaxID=3030990 RepID=UPI0025553700|nr:substrate-binding domain-containing protein [Microtetraspora sp. NBRC 13810]GLW10238.1 hypothetical protein Misp01_53660 [Microtetraspora sp. NBRC 13810]
MHPSGRPLSRRERKKAETRHAIARAARRLFAERGFESVTVTEVAEAADVSAKTVFNYFPAKEQLFFEHEPFLREAPAEAVRGRPPGTSVMDAARGTLHSARDDAAGHDGAGLVAYATVFRDSPALRHHAREVFAGHERDLRRVLEEDGEAAGGRAPGVMAAFLLAPVRETWEATLLRIADGMPPAQAGELGRRELDDAFELLARGLSGEARAASPSAPIRAGLAAPPSAAGGRSRGERPSITRVAQVAGVSATTVSHALNGRRPVAGETRRRVMAAIEQLGYRPNVLARGLRTSRSQTIGLIIPDITNPFYPALARGIQDVLGPAGYDEIISNTDGERRMEQAAIEQMIARQVDGLAFAVFHTHAEDLLPAIEAGIPVVRLGGRLAQAGVDVVHSDDEGGAAEATRYLLERGYRRIGFVCGPLADGPPAERVAGYRTALAAAGVPADPALVVHTQFSRSGGARGTAALLDLAEPPEAVLCANDIMAIGALDIADRRGLRVPDDLAVMGFDDIEAAGLVSPGLTTMANPAREIGQACARRLLARLAGETRQPYGEEIIPSRLVRRASA